jgi:hypothetical protein
MEIVAVLRVLWRRRILVALGGLLAVAVAVTLAHPAAPSGWAKTRVALDTPKSQLVTDAPAGADGLPWRATLLATLLGADPARDQIAREARIPTDRLAVIDLELTAPPVPASLPRAATTAAAVATEPYVLTVHTDDVLPVVSIETTAPDRAGAVRLAGAAVHALQAGASPRSTRELQAFTVERIAAMESVEIPGGGRMKMAAMAIFLFGLWCASLILIPAIGSASRRRGGASGRLGRRRKISLPTAVD